MVNAVRLYAKQQQEATYTYNKIFDDGKYIRNKINDNILKFLRFSENDNDYERKRRYRFSEITIMYIGRTVTLSNTDKKGHLFKTIDSIASSIKFVKLSII